MLASELIFSLRAYHFHFQALESVYFPPGKAGNVFRGALGTILATTPRTDLPSGLADPPRPFVLRAAHLDGRRFGPGETFSLDVHVFDLRAPLREIFVQAFSEWARTGLGPRRGRVELLGSADEAVDIPLVGGTQISKCSVFFRTPTELKGNPSRDAMPFAVLFARVRDRIGALRSLYGEGPPQLAHGGGAWDRGRYGPSGLRRRSYRVSPLPVRGMVDRRGQTYRMGERSDRGGRI